MKLARNLIFVALGLLGWVGGGLAAESSGRSADVSEALRHARLLNQAFVEAVDKASPAVVVLVVEHRSEHTTAGRDRGRPVRESRGAPEDYREWWRRQLEQSPIEGSGSGIVIREDGYILTNTHVVKGADKITVRFKDGRRYPATIRGIDPQSEVAVVKIEAKALVTAKIGDSSKTRVGEFAITIGAPFELDYSATFGHISALGRSEIFSQAEMIDQNFFQTDASINPGNSGGPLINIEGEVIGINTIIRGIGTGVGFAIPSNFAMKVAEQLIEKGRYVRSWIGLEVTDFGEFPKMSDFTGGVSDGVIVIAVDPLGPAAASELSAGDIIRRVASKPVNTRNEMARAVRGRSVGEDVTFEFIRLNAERKPIPMSAKLKPGEFPERIFRRARSRWPGGQAEANESGLSIMDMTEQLARSYRLPLETGVVITALQKGLDPEFLGPGDIVTKIDGHRVTGVESFLRAARNADLRKGVLIQYVSDHPLRQDWERVEIVSSID